MKYSSSFIKEIKNYLLGEEGFLARKDLYQKYDELSHGGDFSTEVRLKIAARVRLRLRQAMRLQRRNWLSALFHNKPALLAALLLLFGAAAFLTKQALIKYNQGGNYREEYVMLFNSIGDSQNMDDLLAGDSLVFGNMLVKKDSKGAISCFSLNPQADMNTHNTLVTPRSMKAELILADGTKVLLNGGSKLHYPLQFEAGHRSVDLEGEAFFAVRKDNVGSRFFVRTDGQSTEVLGTKFNIKAYPHEDEITTLVEGVVKVSLIDDAKKNIVLSAGQQATVKTSEINVQTVDMQPVIGWTQDVFYFNGRNTSEVFAEIERWYGVQIDYQESLNRPPYVGKIPRELSLDNLIRLLSYADFTVRVKI